VRTSVRGVLAVRLGLSACKTPTAIRLAGSSAVEASCARRHSGGTSVADSRGEKYLQPSVIGIKVIVKASVVRFYRVNA
jgi:hypothetical protein